MRQVRVNPRLIGWSGDWSFAEMPQTRDSPSHTVARELGDRLGIEPYRATMIVALNEWDEGRTFIFRNGALIPAPYTPDGHPENLERAEG